jgi:tyrosyl-tRNA synthetase
VKAYVGMMLPVRAVNYDSAVPTTMPAIVGSDAGLTGLGFDWSFVEGENPVEILFNGDWLNELKLADILKIAENFSVQQFLEVFEPIQ